jgi:hypothetical protein
MEDDFPERGRGRSCLLLLEHLVVVWRRRRSRRLKGFVREEEMRDEMQCEGEERGGKSVEYTR